jgi:hypothetical protein
MIVLKLLEADEAYLKRLFAEIGPKALFAASLGMNRTMNEAQDAIRQGLQWKFTVRRKSFIESTIYRQPGKDFASKTNLQAGVRIHEERNVLAKFEEGGLKLPTGGRKALAIPVGVKRNKNDIVTAANSVKALLASGKAFIKNGKVWQIMGRGKKKTLKLAYVFKKSVPLRPDLHFVATGSKVIMERAVPNIAGAIQIELDRGLTSKSGAA